MNNMIKHFSKLNYKIQQFADFEQSRLDFNKSINYVFNIYHVKLLY